MLAHIEIVHMYCIVKQILNSLSRQGEAFIEKSDDGKTPCSVARSHLFREYFRENELIKETILTCLSGAQVGWI